MADITRPTNAHDFTRLNPLAFATDLVLAGKDETISERQRQLWAIAVFLKKG